LSEVIEWIKAVNRPATPIGKTERIVGIVILATLMVIAAAILHVQDRLNPAMFSVPTQRSTRPDLPLTVDPGPQSSVIPQPGKMEALGPFEVFTPSTLSDKINGKAELYLSAGFIRLESRRFRPAGEPDLWAEFFAYDMGGPRNAYSVYSAQRREGAASSTVATDDYKTANALFFVHGKYYVEIVASHESEAAGKMLKRLAEAFVQETRAAQTVIRERDLFPKSGLVPGSISLQSKNVFGFDRLDNVFTARYRIGDAQLTTFISRRENAREATELSAAFFDFLLAFGGRALEPSGTIPGARGVEILDAYELFFTHGPFFAGIHEAEKMVPAARMADILKARLKETADAQ